MSSVSGNSQPAVGSVAQEPAVEEQQPVSPQVDDEVEQLAKVATAEKPGN